MSTPTPTVPSKKTNVVIVGGSSGALVARGLVLAKKRFDPSKHTITLISQLPYSVYLVASARMAVTTSQNLDDPKAANGAFMPYDKLFSRPGSGISEEDVGKFVHAKVVGVHEKDVELEDGSKVAFDYLVVATGSTWAGPMSFSDYSTDAEVRGHLAGWRERIAKARSVVIVGGGSVGVELAGEIRHFHPNISITIIHALPGLLNDTYPDRLRNALLKKVEDAGVRVILGDRVVDLPREGLSADDKQHLAQVKTSSGKVLEADLVIPVIGARPNPSILRSLRNGSVLTSSKLVRVTRTLNVQFADGVVSENIFATGDIIDWKEQRGLGKASQHAAAVSENILRALEGKKWGEGKPYGGLPEIMMVTFGPNGGLFYLPFFWGIILGDWATRLIKSKNLFVPRFRAMYGLQ